MVDFATPTPESGYASISVPEATDGIIRVLGTIPGAAGGSSLRLAYSNAALERVAPSTATPTIPTWLWIVAGVLLLLALDGKDRS